MLNIKINKSEYKKKKRIHDNTISIATNIADIINEINNFTY